MTATFQYNLHLRTNWDVLVAYLSSTGLSRPGLLPTRRGGGMMQQLPRQSVSHSYMQQIKSPVRAGQASGRRQATGSPRPARRGGAGHATGRRLATGGTVRYGTGGLQERVPYRTVTVQVPGYCFILSE